MSEDGEVNASNSGDPFRLSGDLLLVVLAVLIADVVILSSVADGTILQVLAGLPLALFLPGYVAIAALFPENSKPSEEGPDITADNPAGPVRETGKDHSSVRGGISISGLERIALALGLSIAITPLIGLGLDATVGIRLVPVVLAISGFVLFTAGIAVIRRWRLPAEERFHMPIRQRRKELYSSALRPDSRTDAVLNILVVVCLILAAGGVSYVASNPKDDEPFSSLYLLDRDASGDLTASGYPENFTVGESESLVVGVENHENEPAQYTLVVELQYLGAESGSTRVLREETLHRFTPSLGVDETWQRPHRIEPTLTGRQLRLTYLLYRGDPPSEPTIDTAYQEVHLRINVADHSPANASARRDAKANRALDNRNIGVNTGPASRNESRSAHRVGAPSY